MSDAGLQRLVARLVPEGARVLDLGCGDGALLDLLQRATEPGGLDGVELDWDPRTAVTVVLASRGYPASSSSGDLIHGLDAVPAGAEVVHAGTAERGGDVVTAGGRVLGGAHHAHALAVVAAPGGLQHHRPPDVGGEGLEVRDVAHGRPPRDRDAQGGQPLAHDQLVLGVHQRLRARAHRHPGRRERAQVLGGHLLVVQGEDGGAVGQGGQRGGVRRGAQGCVGDHLGGGLVGALGDNGAEVREQAAWALGAIGDPRGAPRLTLALKDQSAKVRQQAAWALGVIGGRDHN